MQSGRFMKISASSTGPAADGATASTGIPVMDNRARSSSGGAVTSTNSFSQLYRIFMAARLRELAQEARVVLEKKLQVVDVVLQHRQPVHAHAERKSRHPLRIVLHKAVDRRVHHARAEQLDP